MTIALIPAAKGSRPTRLIAAGGCLLGLAVSLCAWPLRAEAELPKAEVTLGGAVFRVDVADTPRTQALGLGGRTHLGPGEGMLFVYARKDTHSFWMRRMVIPIDILWLDNDRVVHIEHNVPPPAPGTALRGLPTYRPREKANLVLEIAAGRAKALGVSEGDRARFRFNVR